jgi:hypothetical protein
VADFQNFARFSKFRPIFKISPDFQNFAWFSKFCPIFKMLPEFQNFTQFSKFHPSFKILPEFQNLGQPRLVVQLGLVQIRGGLDRSQSFSILYLTVKLARLGWTKREREKAKC